MLNNDFCLSAGLEFFLNYHLVNIDLKYIAIHRERE